MFQAIQHSDNTALRSSFKTFIGAKNDPAALLCLDHLFSSPLGLQNLPLSEVHALLSHYHTYISLLNKFRRDQSLVNGSNHQRLFGFQVVGENRWLVPKHSLLHGRLTEKSGSSGQKASGYKCGFDVLHKGVIAILENRINDRTRTLNEACSSVHGFSPCLRLLAQEKCDLVNQRGLCTFQHIKPERLSVDWYHTRLRLILLQFQILESAHLLDFQTARCVLLPFDTHRMSVD